VKPPPPRFAVRLRECGRVRCEPGWHLGPAWAAALRDFDLWFVWAGRGRLRLRDRLVELAPGACFWMRPGGRYEAEQDSSAPLGVNFIHFELRDPRGGAPAGFAPPFEFLQTRQVDFTDAVMRRVIALHHDRVADETAGREADAVAAELFAALLRELAREALAARAGEPPGARDRRHDLVMRVAAEIRESPGAAPAVAALARAAGCSPDHFARVFRRITGLPPQDYIVRAKIERARQLLAESALSVGGIADALGFEDIYFFSRQFKQKTGRTPTGYRRALGADPLR
jgi:AraC-like DNA-binding protein